MNRLKKLKYKIEMGLVFAILSNLKILYDATCNLRQTFQVKQFRQSNVSEIISSLRELRGGLTAAVVRGCVVHVFLSDNGQYISQGRRFAIYHKQCSNSEGFYCFFLFLQFHLVQTSVLFTTTLPRTLQTFAKTVGTARCTLAKPVKEYLKP